MEDNGETEHRPERPRPSNGIIIVILIIAVSLACCKWRRTRRIATTWGTRESAEQGLDRDILTRTEMARCGDDESVDN